MDSDLRGTNLVDGGCRGPVTIRQVLVVIRCVKKGGSGGCAGTSTPPKMLLDKGDKVLTFNGLKERRLVAQRRFEGGHSGG